MAVFGLGMLGIGLPEQGESVSPGIYVLGFCMYVALSFVTIYFNAAVIGTAMKRLRGEDAKIADGLALARQHIGKIFVWALITATIGMILRQIQENAGILGRIVIGIVGIAWSVLTYFVVPVLLYEPVGVGQSIKRSAQIFRERWGEQFIGNATIGLAVVIIGIPVVLVGALLTARCSRRWASRCWSSRSARCSRSARRAPACSTRRCTGTPPPARRRVRSAWTT